MSANVPLSFIRPGNAVFRAPRHPQLRGGGSAELARGRKRMETYFESANPLSKLVQLV